VARVPKLMHKILRPLYGGPFAEAVISNALQLSLQVYQKRHTFPVRSVQTDENAQRNTHLRIAPQVPLICLSQPNGRCYPRCAFRLVFALPVTDRTGKALRFCIFPNPIVLVSSTVILDLSWATFGMQWAYAITNATCCILGSRQLCTTSRCHSRTSRHPA